MGIGTGMIGLGLIGSCTGPPPEPADGKPAAEQVPRATTSHAPTPTPSTSAAPVCHAPGEAPKAPEVSGPTDHARLGRLTCTFEHGRLDDAEVPVTITNKGAQTASYTITVELLDSANDVIESADARTYGLDPGKPETRRATLVGWGKEIDTDGKGFRTRVTAVERTPEKAPEPPPTETTGGGGGGDIDMPTVTPGAFCGDGDAAGVSKKGRLYHCRDGHWRR